MKNFQKSKHKNLKIRCHLPNLKRKLIFFSILFLSLLTNRLNAQGVDVIFMMDNSASIINSEWNSMTATTNDLIDEVLGCSPNNRIAVVHYGSTEISFENYINRIYIESDFTNDVTIAKDFERRTPLLGNQDLATKSLAIIGDALDNIANTGIVSPQATLNRAPNNRLVIFLFTDAYRDSSSSNVVDMSNPTNPFGIYNSFKADRNTSFVVLHVNPGAFVNDLAAVRRAVAAISSVGGSYMGDIENNPGDPEGNGVKPRKAFMQGNSFALTPAEISSITEDICKSCLPNLEINPLTPATQNVSCGATPQTLATNASGSGTISYQWYSNISYSTTGGIAITGATNASYIPPTNEIGTTYYYVIVSDSNCEATVTSDIMSVTVSGSCFCYKPGNFDNSGLSTDIGISSLDREILESYEWPHNRSGAWLVLGSKTKGFVPTRLDTAEIAQIQNPVEGMIVYDKQAFCLKIYTVRDNVGAWECYDTQTCPD